MESVPRTNQSISGIIAILSSRDDDGDAGLIRGLTAILSSRGVDLDHHHRPISRSNPVPTSDIYMSDKCTVCFGTDNMVMFEPCGHICACKECYDQLDNKQCVICRKTITSTREMKKC